MTRTILDLKDVKLCSINRKFTLGRRGNKRILCTTSEYKKHKELVKNSVVKDHIFDKNVTLIFKVKAYSDIDCYVKPTLDALTDKDIGILPNDRDILTLIVIKEKLSNNRLPVSIKVLVIDELCTHMNINKTYPIDITRGEDAKG